MVTNKKNNSGITALFIFILIPFFSISGIREVISPTVYQGWQVLSVGLLFFILCISRVLTIRINWAMGLFTLYHIVILGSTFLNQGLSGGIFVITMAYVFIFILLQTSYYQEIIASISLIVVFSAVINLWSMFKEGNELYSIFFIGGKNALSMFLIPGAFLLLIYALEKHGKVDVKTIIVIAICLISVYIGASGTGMVVATIAAAFMILALKTSPSKHIYIILILVFYMLFIFFADDFLATEYWLKFTDFLGKDNTLTSRTTIWEMSMDFISENWLFGSGRGTEFLYLDIWGERQRVQEAHNFILEILMEGGVVALTIYASLLYKTIKRLDVKDVRHKIIFMSLCVMLVNGLTESTLNNFFVTIILSIACRYACEERGGITVGGQQA